MTKTCIITGINGQLAQFMAQHLLETEPDIRVIGTLRHKSFDNQPYIFDRSRITIELMDLSDSHSIENLIVRYKPDYFINTAANAFVGESWSVPSQHYEINCLAVLHQLEAIRKYSPHTRYFNMGTSEEFGVSTVTGAQDETTPLAPKSPYGASKCAARHTVEVWRQSYHLYALQGWTYNFESSIRGEKYVTRKITKGVARIVRARQDQQPFEPIALGNLDSSRSWQHALDVADGIWRMLNQEKYRAALSSVPEEDLWAHIRPYVLSAPDTHTVREFVVRAFSIANIYGVWWDSGFRDRPQDEVFLLGDIETGLACKKAIPLVKVDPQFYRPSDVTYLHGDASRARAELGWTSLVLFDQLVEQMVLSDLRDVGITLE